MICKNCNQNEANVHFTQVLNNTKVEMHLCDRCAKEMGKLVFGSQLSINDFFSGLLGLSQSQSQGYSYIQKAPASEVCKKCGMSFEDFQKVGKLGCDECYALYGERILPLFKKLHGNTEHIGKYPSKISECVINSKEVEKLRSQLVKAIAEEDYEQAAVLRDKIKALEVEV